MQAIYHLENDACEQPKGHGRYVRDFLFLALEFAAL